jgi:hypothetical protein
MKPRTAVTCSTFGTVALIVVVAAALGWLAVGITFLSLPAFARGNGVLFVSLGVAEAGLPYRATPWWMVTEFRRDPRRADRRRWSRVVRAGPDRL